METTVNQRIKLIIENSGLTLNSFSKLVGIAQTSLRDCVVNNAEPKYSTLDKIIKSNPSINPEWLWTGNGKML
jgi:predicted transcriptional regulator